MCLCKHAHTKKGMRCMHAHWTINSSSHTHTECTRASSLILVSYIYTHVYMARWHHIRVHMGVNTCFISFIMFVCTPHTFFFLYLIFGFRSDFQIVHIYKGMQKCVHRTFQNLCNVFFYCICKSANRCNSCAHKNRTN